MWDGNQDFTGNGDEDDVFDSSHPVPAVNWPMAMGETTMTAVDSQTGNEEKQVITLQSKTWQRESHGLYDYESSDIVAKTEHLPHACTVLRKDTNVLIQPPSVSNEAEPLARLIVRNGVFCVDGTRNLGNIGDGVRKGGKLWRVVKDVPGGHHLREGDSIKLGRFKLRVRQLVVPTSGNAPDASEGILATVNGAAAPRFCRSNPEGYSDEEQLPCRICLLEDSTRDDPLLRPCECRGTIECVHLVCLRHWIRGRLDLSESSTGSYFYRPFPCELCKAQYATHMLDADGGEPVPIVELPKTQPPFVVLERDSNRPDSKGAHVISLAERKLLKLGRGHESDVRFADVSISRWHADICFDQSKGGNKGGAFILSDHDSKFGTLVAMRGPVQCEKAPLTFQAGRSLLEFKISDSKVVALDTKTEEASGGEPAPIPIRNSVGGSVD